MSQKVTKNEIINFLEDCLISESRTDILPYTCRENNILMFEYYYKQFKDDEFIDMTLYDCIDELDVKNPEFIIYLCDSDILTKQQYNYLLHTFLEYDIIKDIILADKNNYIDIYHNFKLERIHFNIFKSVCTISKVKKMRIDENGNKICEQFMSKIET